MHESHKYEYTEIDFMACLLIHGWGVKEDFTSHYWARIDEWFKQQWPDRWSTEHPAEQPHLYGNHTNYEAQMEFKLQFFSWVRTLPQKAAYRTRPDHIVPHKSYTGV